MSATTAYMQSCSDRLSLWDRVTISSEIEGSREQMESRIEDFNEQLFLLSLPDAGTRIRYGTKVEVSFLEENGISKFSAVMDTSVVNGRQYLSLKPLTRIRHEQRRMAVRVSMHLDLEVASISRPIQHAVKVEDLFWEETTSIDFSSTGLLIQGTRLSSVGDLLVVKFRQDQLPQSPEYGLASWKRLQVVNETPRVGLEFITREKLERSLSLEEAKHLDPKLTRLTEAHINAFSKFVFDYELKQRQRGDW